MKVRFPRHLCGPDAVRIPAQSFPTSEPRSVCFVVLEVKNLVNPKNRLSFYSLLKDMAPDLDIRPFDERSKFRVRVNEDDVELIQSMAKAIAERRGKNVRGVRCVEIEGLHEYESPRD